jgi:hypothetical protein
MTTEEKEELKKELKWYTKTLKKLKGKKGVITDRISSEEKAYKEKTNKLMGDLSGLC